VRNPYEVLREKELQLQLVKGEVEALRLVVPLLEGEDTASDNTAKRESEACKEATTGLKIPTQKWP
jgi:hypothetical protein